MGFEYIIPIILVITLIISLLTGYPVAFVLGGVAVIVGLFGIDFSLFQLIPIRIWGLMTNFTLLAVPLFVFMGILLEKSKIAEELLDTAGLIFGKISGGLAYSVLVVGGLLAATTGIVGATVVTMGLIAVPTMLKRGYNIKLTAGLVAASGTLGQIIPPSIILVILGDIVNIPVGDLFLAATLPGMMILFLYGLLIFVISVYDKNLLPPIPKNERDDISAKELFIKAAKVLLPPTILIIAVLGSIFAGIASPTESASVGAVGALILAIISGNFSIELLKESMDSTLKITAMIFFIFLGATTFGLVFRGVEGDDFVRNMLIIEGFSPYFSILIIMITLFLLGFILDFVEIIFIVIPIVTPIVLELGFDPTWFAIMVAVNLQTSFLTPPFGFSIFYLKGVAPENLKTTDIYLGVIPFVLIQLLVITLIGLFPEIALFLPDYVRELMFGS